MKKRTKRSRPSPDDLADYEEYIKRTKQLAEEGSISAAQDLRFLHHRHLHNEEVGGPGILKTTEGEIDTTTERPAIRLDGFYKNLRLLAEDPVHLRNAFIRNIAGAVYGTDFYQHLSLFWNSAIDFLRDEGHIAGKFCIEEADLDYYEQPEHSAKLTPAQKNALEVLRLVRRFQATAFARKPVFEQSGPIQFDPIINFDLDGDGYPKKPFAFESQKEKNGFNLVFNEAILLILAVIKIDFNQILWPRIEKNARRTIPLSRGSAAGVKKRKESDKGRLLDNRKQACRDKATTLLLLKNPTAKSNHIWKTWDDFFKGQFGRRPTKYTIRRWIDEKPSPKIP